MSDLEDIKNVSLPRQQGEEITIRIMDVIRDNAMPGIQATEGLCDLAGKTGVCQISREFEIVGSLTSLLLLMDSVMRAYMIRLTA